jgi:hypothetical protein
MHVFRLFLILYVEIKYVNREKLALIMHVFRLFLILYVEAKYVNLDNLAIIMFAQIVPYTSIIDLYKNVNKQFFNYLDIFLDFSFFLIRIPKLN